MQWTIFRHVFLTQFEQKLSKLSNYIVETFVELISANHIKLCVISSSPENPV
jgi:hypothetical protein